MSPQSPTVPPSMKRSTSGRDPRARGRLVERRDFERREARRRIAARATSRLDEGQRAFDPLSHADRAPRRRAVMFGVALLASLAAHVVLVGSGLGWRWMAPPPRVHDEVRIEMRERPPQPVVAPEPPPAPPPPPPPVEKRPPRVARVAEPPPEAPPPAEAPKVPPPRIVGLSLDSTTASGEGPGFAVGNTRMGETDKKAVAPRDVLPATAGAPPIAAPSGPSTINQVATRIPVAGVKYGLPRRRNKKEPPYPATLESQGIEADVTVMVSIDERGRVTAVKLIKEAAYPEFNQAARTAAMAEDFDPATRDGVPIPYQLSFTYRFRLKDQ